MLCTLMYRSQPYMRILKIDIAICAFVRAHTKLHPNRKRHQINRTIEPIVRCSQLVSVLQPSHLTVRIITARHIPSCNDTNPQKRSTQPSQGDAVNRIVNNSSTRTSVILNWITNTRSYAPELLFSNLSVTTLLPPAQRPAWWWSSASPDRARQTAA
jgi:hypothetical protein